MFQFCLSELYRKHENANARFELLLLLIHQTEYLYETFMAFLNHIFCIYYSQWLLMRSKPIELFVRLYCVFFVYVYVYRAKFVFHWLLTLFLILIRYIFASILLIFYLFRLFDSISFAVRWVFFLTRVLQTHVTFNWLRTHTASFSVVQTDDGTCSSADNVASGVSNVWIHSNAHLTRFSI